MSDNIAKVDAWLDGPSGWPASDDLTVLDVLARLSAQNGFDSRVPKLTRHGHDGPFAGWGLTQGEAIELSNLAGVMFGIRLLNWEAADRIVARCEAYWDEHCAEFKDGGDDGTETD